MRNLKVLAVVGLAVAVAVSFVTPVFACGPVSVMAVNVSGVVAQAGTLTFTIASREDQPKTLLAGTTTVQQGERAGVVAQRLVQQLDKNRQELGTVTPFTAVTFVGTDESGTIRVENPKLVDHNCPITGDGQTGTLQTGTTESVTILGLTFKIENLPTLTQWGLIALGVLLAGTMGFVLYRRRPTARPALP